MAQVVWQGTADVDGYEHPMRVVKDADDRLMTEWANDTETEDGGRAFDTNHWYADYQKQFRDMDPAPTADLIAQMTAAKLLD